MMMEKDKGIVMNLMERRTFLKAIICGVVAVGAPLPIGFSKVQGSAISDDFYINSVTKTVHYVGRSKKLYTVQEFYEYLMDCDFSRFPEPKLAVVDSVPVGGPVFTIELDE